MKIELQKWTLDLKEDLIRISNMVDRTYLSNKLPYPYTEQAADWWLSMVFEHDEVDAVYRAITVDGKVVGTISIEQGEDVYCCDGEMGAFIIDECKSQGVMTEAVKQIMEIAFSKLKIERITAKSCGPNLAAHKVLQKCGLTQEAVLRKAVRKYGKVYDLYVFGYVKD